MKNSLTCLLFLMLSGMSAKADVFDDFVQAIQKQNESSLQKVFSNQVDLEIEERSQTKLSGEKTSAELLKFILTHEFSSFSINHKSDGTKARNFAVGTYTTKEKVKYRFTIVAIEQEGKWKISALTIEKT